MGNCKIIPVSVKYPEEWFVGNKLQQKKQKKCIVRK